MNSNSWFKLVASFIDWIKSSIIAFPISFAFINVLAYKQKKFQYGYDFFELDHRAAIIIALGLGVVLTAWNAMAFAESGAYEPRQYLKPKQSYRLRNSKGLSVSEIRTRIEEMMTEKPKWKLKVNEGAQSFRIEIRNIIRPRDVATIHRDSDGWIITCRPKWKIYFVDMARNLKNVQYISSKISSKE